MKLFIIDKFDKSDFFKIVENDDIFVATKIEYNFVSKQFFKFIKFLIKNKIIEKKINVVFIENITDNAKIAIDWLVSIKNDYLPNINIYGEFDAENLSDKFEIQTVFEVKNETFCEKQIIEGNNVIIYTDGACSGNPGAGGWGAILMHGDHKKEISGFEKETTNNRMELTAVIEALTTLKAPCNVELYSDSAYVTNAILQGWLENWKRNGWIGSDKKKVKNLDLWINLNDLLNTHNVHFNKVKGHSDNEFNNRCDSLATGEIAKHANE